MKENKFVAYVSLFGSLFIMTALTLMCCFAVWSDRDSQPEQRGGYTADSLSGVTEDKEQNRTEGILYTIDDTEKVTLTSTNGEICVKIPRWNGFSSELIELMGWEILSMKCTENYDSMTFRLLASWDMEETGAEIIADFGRFVDHDDVLGDIYHMTVNEIEIYYQTCHEQVYWHYMVWADLGCGQILTTEFWEGLQSDEPLNIEGVIELLYSNIEVCTAQGEPIAITYRESLPLSDEKEYDTFSFGRVREYKTDEYRENTVCAELIESLYAAVQTGGSEELLLKDTIEGRELSIAEKMEYIKKEETGTLIKYDSPAAYGRGYHPTKCYLVEGTDNSEEFLVYRFYYSWENKFEYRWFLCEKNNDGNVRAQKGIHAYLEDREEPYFLNYQGNPYLYIVNRDAKDEIESVVLYDFATPDYIGTIICIDASSVYLCSYVRSDDNFGTISPWYLYDNRIDKGKEYFAMPEHWKITEYLGESGALYVEDTDSAAYVRAQERTQELMDAYLGQEINMKNWNSHSHYVTYFRSASEYGYYYTSLENLYKVYRQPETLAMEAPLSCATMQVVDFDEDIDIIVDKNGKAAICVEGRFFRLEKSSEETEELRTWE